MSPFSKLVGGALAVVVVLAAGLYAYRALVHGAARTPDDEQLLAAMPGTDGFEPRALPTGPVLANQSRRDLAIAFGYKVGATPFSYAIALSFPAGGDTGRATVTARHAGQESSVETSVVRRWDEPRKAYAVALQEKVDMQPTIPALCIKIVVGPQADSYDLRDASLCVAQRDAAGTCHPETLACGLIR